MTTKPDTANMFGVGVVGDDVSILMAVPHRMSRDDARNLGVYLIVMADIFESGHTKTDELMKAVERT